MTPNPQLMPFKTMRATIALLQGAVLPILVTLKVEDLSQPQRVLIACIIVTREKTTQVLKSNPTRKQLLTLCGAWRRWAVDVQRILIPAEQPALVEALEKALTETEWIKRLDTPEAVPEVRI